MKNTNAAIYGPPAHKLDSFSLRFAEGPDGWTLSSAFGHSPTSKPPIWHLNNVGTAPLDDTLAPQMALIAYCFVHDLLRDLPSTQERAQFVASGGLYEQLPLF